MERGEVGVKVTKIMGQKVEVRGGSRPGEELSGVVEGFLVVGEAERGYW